MFYQATSCAFQIVGVYHIKREEAQSRIITDKKHTSILYRIKGTTHLHCETKAFAVCPTDVAYIPAGSNFRRISEEGELIVVLLQAFGEVEREIQLVSGAAFTESLFRKLHAVWESKEPAAYNRAASILYSLLEALQTAKDSEIASVPAAIQPGVLLLWQNYRNGDLHVSDLAKASFVSDVYFRNVFRAHFGKSPKKALSELRFRHACDLLGTGYYSQKEVARLSGFQDVKFFRTAFKKQFGITPSEYQKTP